MYCGPNVIRECGGGETRSVPCSTNGQAAIPEVPPLARVSCLKTTTGNFVTTDPELDARCTECRPIEIDGAIWYEFTCTTPDPCLGCIATDGTCVIGPSNSALYIFGSFSGVGYCITMTNDNRNISTMRYVLTHSLVRRFSICAVPGYPLSEYFVRPVGMAKRVTVRFVRDPVEEDDVEEPLRRIECSTATDGGGGGGGEVSILDECTNTYTGIFAPLGVPFDPQITCSKWEWRSIGTATVLQEPIPESLPEATNSCRSPGSRCSSDENCCSSRCQGLLDIRVCRNNVVPKA